MTESAWFLFAFIALLAVVAVLSHFIGKWLGQWWVRRG